MPITSRDCCRGWNRAVWASRYWSSKRRRNSTFALPEGSDIGLMQPDISESHETIFASAAFPGRWAAPGPQGAASPFTRAVSKAIREPGLMLAQVFDVAKQDKALTQTPYVMDVLRQQQQFYFHPPVKTPDWPRPGIPVSNRNDREEYLWIRPARFLMGCVPGDNRCSAAEKPQHEVTITKGFWMGRNEVQVGSYQRYVKAKGVRMPSAPMYDKGWKVSDQPVVNVRWEDAAALLRLRRRPATDRSRVGNGRARR